MRAALGACLFERLLAIHVASPIRKPRKHHRQSPHKVGSTKPNPLEHITKLADKESRNENPKIAQDGESVLAGRRRVSSGDGHAVAELVLRAGGRPRRSRAAAAPGDTDPRHGGQPAGGAADGGVQAVEPGVPGVAAGAGPRRVVPPLVRPLRAPRALHHVLRRADDALLRRRCRRLPQRTRRGDQGLRLRLHLHTPIPRPKPQAADWVHEHSGEHAGEGRVRGGARPVRRAVRLPVRAGRAGAPFAGGQRVPAAPQAPRGDGVRGERRPAGDPRGAQPRRAVRAAAAGAEPAALVHGARGATGDAVGAVGRVGAGDAHLRVGQHAGRAVRGRLPHPRRAAQLREQPVAAAHAQSVRQHHAGGVAAREPDLLRQEHDAVPAGHRVRGRGGAVPRADTAARRGPAGARRAGDVPGGHRRRHGGEPRVRGPRLRRGPRDGRVRRRRRDGEPGQPHRPDQGVVRLAGAGGGGGGAAQGVALRHP